MAEQDKESKTEPATAKHRGEARSKGMVARSQDLSAAITITAGLLILGAIGSRLFAVMTSYLRDSITGHFPREMNSTTVSNLLVGASERFLPVVGVLLASLLVVSAAAGYMQVGFQINLKAIEWDFTRVNPVKGFGSLFRMRTLIRVGISLVKTAIVVTAAYLPIKADLPQISLLDRSDLSTVISFMGALLSKAAFGACITLLVVGIIDFYYQKWQYEKDLKMTKQEVKDESKQAEGDPATRSRIRKKRFEIAMRRMMAEVPKATVVVTNPTHYAVALRYVVDEDRAPMIVAKGKDLIAMKIREIATEYKIPIVENKPLAQSLYRGGEVGEEIPAALYRAVAELLSYVFRLRGKI